MKKLVAVAAVLGALTLPAAAMANGTPAGHGTYYLEQALSGIPKDKAENFKDTMQQAHEQSKDLYNQAHQLRDDMRQLLTAQEFDENAFIAKSQELRQVQDKIAANLDHAFADAASQLTPGERSSVANELERLRQEHQAAKAAKKTPAQ